MGSEALAPPDVVLIYSNFGKVVSANRTFVSYLQNGYRAFVKQMFGKRLICARCTKDPHLLEVTAFY